MKEILTGSDIVVGEIFGCVDVNPLVEKLDLLRNVIFRREVELEVVVDHPVFGRLIAEFVEIFRAIGAGEEQRDRTFFISSEERRVGNEWVSTCSFRW